MRPTSNHQLSLAQFTTLIEKLEPETRSKIFFSFRRILGPEALIEHNRRVREKFRKRNNPSEEDQPMLSEIVSSQSNNRQIEKAGERRGTFDDIVPIDN